MDRSVRTSEIPVTATRESASIFCEGVGACEGYRTLVYSLGYPVLLWVPTTPPSIQTLFD